METIKNGRIESVHFESFLRQGVIHGIYKRHGGVSPSPWNSLNVGNTVGDSPENPPENLRRIFQSAKLPLNSLHQVWQVHSTNIALVQTPSSDQRPDKADGMISKTTCVTLFMRFADCVPILLFDTSVKAIGIAHAGWLGTVRKSARAVLLAMVEKFGTDPSDVIAGLGPSIGPDHFEVGEDVQMQFMNAFPESGKSHITSINDKVHLDLWSANREILAVEGVTNIETAGICTACHPEDWFSHRAEQGNTGRFGALISLGGT